MKKIREMMKSRKGFTLVEMIVVLVILAILAAFTIPAMLGFVGDARGKANLAEAREVKIAYQAAVTEVVSTNSAGTTGVADATYTETAPTDATQILVQNKALAQLNGDLSNGTAINTGITYKVTVSSGKVTLVKYNHNGYTITINNDGTTAVKQEASIS